MLVEDTVENRALAKAVQRRVDADASMVGARAALARLGGFALLMIGIGIGAGGGIALGCFGYSYVSENQAAADRIAEALSRSLTKVTVKTEGTVRLEDKEVGLKPGGVVTLAPGTSVGLDREATVRLEPGGMVGLKVDQLERVIAGTGGPQKTASGEVIRREVTVFYSVQHGAGTVTSGWNYADGSGGSPTSQFCYYAIDTGKQRASMRVDLGAEKNGDKSNS